MATNKYINTSDVVELTGRTPEEIRVLAQSGELPAHKTRRGHWRFNVEVIEKYFDIQINKPKEVKPKEEVVKPVYPSVPKPTSETRLIINVNHYEEVIKRICEAKSSIKIMTADFKRFRLKPTGSQGKDYNDGTPFIEFLMAKAVQGVSVQIICSRPSSSFTEEWEEYYKQMGKPKLFEYMFCIRNHAKIYIIDDKLAYIGSANVTPAGLGQGIFTPGNFEAGILTENKELVSSAKKFFSEIWDEKVCEGCHRADKCED